MKLIALLFCYNGNCEEVGDVRQLVSSWSWCVGSRKNGQTLLSDFVMDRWVRASQGIDTDATLSNQHLMNSNTVWDPLRYSDIYTCRSGLKTRDSWALAVRTRLWNDFGEEIGQAASVSIFKSLLKIHLCKKAFCWILWNMCCIL